MAMVEDIAGVRLSRPDAPAAGDATVRRWDLLGRLESAAIGKRARDGAVYVRRREVGGCVLYGPYLHLSAGFYRLNFVCRVGSARLSAQPVLGVEVVVLARFQRAWRDFTAAELASGTGSLVFEVTPEHAIESGNEGRFEFRFFHLGNADLAITAVDLARLEQAPAAPANRRWRMLGRLEKTWIGARDRSGTVHVRRREPAGNLLYAGRPYLRLSRGAYRLSLAVRSGTPRLAGQPVLGVEMIGQTATGPASWRAAFRPVPEPNGVPLVCHEIIAAEIGTAPVEIDFAVPPELSLESGGGMPFDIRLRHFGNADVAIDAIDVVRVNGGEIRHPAATARWHLLGRRRNGPIGAAAAGGISIGTGEPPGKLLFSGRPWLRLPEGHYRLSLAGQMAKNNDGSQSLRVEVEAHPAHAGRTLRPAPAIVLGSREVTASALNAGSAAIEFAVSPELALGSGNARLAASVIRLGHGALHLTAVDIERCPEPATHGSTGPVRLRQAGRRRIVMIGNCQMETLRQGFGQIETLNNRFEVKYHFVQLPSNLHEYAIRDLESCDILLAQDIRLWDEFPLRDAVRPGADLFKVPLVRFASLWPFDAWNGPGDKEAHDREGPNLTFPYLDGLLGRLRREIPDPEARFRAYATLEWPGIVNYRRLHQLEERRLAAMDKQFGVGIGSFILENFQKRRVFHTTVRPNWQLFSRLMQFVAGLVGVREDIALSKSGDALLRNPQVPVHPRVARDLGVKWADARTPYLSRGVEVTWESYIRSYIDHYG